MGIVDLSKFKVYSDPTYKKRKKAQENLPCRCGFPSNKVHRGRDCWYSYRLFYRGYYLGFTGETKLDPGYVSAPYIPNQ